MEPEPVRKLVKDIELIAKPALKEAVNPAGSPSYDGNRPDGLEETIIYFSPDRGIRLTSGDLYGNHRRH